MTSKIFWDIRSDEVIYLLTEELRNKLDSLEDKEKVWEYDSIDDAPAPTKEDTFIIAGGKVYVNVDGKWERVPTMEELAKLLDKVNNGIDLKEIVDAIKDIIDEAKDDVPLNKDKLKEDINNKLDELNPNDGDELDKLKEEIAKLIDKLKPTGKNDFDKLLKDIIDLTKNKDVVNTDEIDKLKEDLAKLKEAVENADGMSPEDKSKLDKITVTQPTNLDTIKSKTDKIQVTNPINLDNIKSKVDNISSTTPINLDDIKSDVASNKSKVDDAKGKTDKLTVTNPINLDELKSKLDKISTPSGTVNLDDINNVINSLASNYVTIATEQNVTGKKTFREITTPLVTGNTRHNGRFWININSQYWDSIEIDLAIWDSDTWFHNIWDWRLKLMSQNEEVAILSKDETIRLSKPQNTDSNAAVKFSTLDNKFLKVVTESEYNGLHKQDNVIYFIKD